MATPQLTTELGAEPKEEKMLANKDAMATVAVKDLGAAKKFYQQTLGFAPIGDEEMGALTLKSGNSMIVVYKSNFAGTNKATHGDLGRRQRDGLDREDAEEKRRRL